MYAWHTNIIIVIAVLLLVRISTVAIVIIAAGITLNNIAIVSFAVEITFVGVDSEAVYVPFDLPAPICMCRNAAGAPGGCSPGSSRSAGPWESRPSRSPSLARPWCLECRLAPKPPRRREPWLSCATGNNVLFFSFCMVFVYVDRGWGKRRGCN